MRTPDDPREPLRTEWDAFVRDAAAVLAARERLDADLAAVAVRPFDREARGRLRATLESDELAAATTAADRVLEDGPWDR